MQELKEMQDKSLKISLLDYQSGNISVQDMKKMTIQEKSDYLTSLMVTTLNTNVRLRDEKSDRVRGADGKMVDYQESNNP